MSSESEEDHLTNVMSFFLRERHRREIEELNRTIENFQMERVEDLLSDIITVVPIVPPDFWDPVKVTVSDSENKKFEFVDESWECFICREDRTKKTEMKCCKQALCDSCVENWFHKESVKCPFCKKDIREN
ncbi:RING finger protein [Flavobacteriaceae bacterium]|nr:RING finger protein [Flavobacteriaceae bacterium]